MLAAFNSVFVYIPYIRLFRTSVLAIRELRKVFANRDSLALPKY